MKRHVIILSVLIVLAVALPAAAELDENLQDLAPFVGKTYRGELVDEASGKKSVDIQYWEETLGGKALRVTHSLNDGEYGGETILFWDSEIESVAFYYFTTAGFYTHGTMELEDGAYTAVEKVAGNPDGIAEVRSVSRVLEDGRLHMRSEYFKDGAWVPGHEVFYIEAPDAEVVFK